jgi:two-component system CheB/CheR fusion protein
VPKESPDIETLLDFLRRARGFDFTGYKRASLERRIARRMVAVGCPAYADYIDLLEARPDEFEALFNTILINVTHFFRDAANWEFLANSVVPAILERHTADSPIRVWSAGCSSGEEAYTLAMVFAEALGPDAFQRDVKVYATDLDEDALAKARRGTYSEREAADVPRPLLHKYFYLTDNSYAFHNDLRRHIIFGRHDLIQDAPISRIDLLVCRNTLMYFNAGTQARLLARFQFALRDDGVLFLGRAETLMTHNDAFAPIDLKRRISRKISTPNAVHDEAGMPMAANERARPLFSMLRSDVGRRFQDRELSYPPAELRPALAAPIAFDDPVESKRLQRELVEANRALETAYEELQTVNEELETTNAALQSTLEQLETTNEELESTNEELETMNAELQSTNKRFTGYR